MIKIRYKSEIDIYPLNFELAKKLSCPPLVATMLQIVRGTDDAAAIKKWLNPNFLDDISNLELGSGSRAAGKLWHSKSSFGKVLVYGDYDVDGVCSCVMAMEIFRTRASSVKYYIPRRDIQGYGLNPEIVGKIADSGIDTLVVTDCGTNDSAMLESLRRKGIDIFVFDHHAVSAPITIPTIVNPSIDMGASAFQKLCAAAVLWCWAWKEDIVPRKTLQYKTDLAALASIADCMPFHSLTRMIARHGIGTMRGNPRKGLAALFAQLGINKALINEETLSMRVIPCLNAPGRIASADTSVKLLDGSGSRDEINSAASEVIRLNRKRQTLTDSITKEITASHPASKPQSSLGVLYGEAWPIGVLSGVSSRLCAEYGASVVLAAPVGHGIIRGTVRVPEGGDAVGMLREIAPSLQAWGGHKFAAGFSVSNDKWPCVMDSLNALMAGIKTSSGERLRAVSIKPSDITLSDWEALQDTGPFGHGAELPFLYIDNVPSAAQVEELGTDGRHSMMKLSGSRLLSFGTKPQDMAGLTGDAQGWIYRAKLDSWQNVMRLQFLTDSAVLNGERTA